MKTYVLGTRIDVISFNDAVCKAVDFFYDDAPHIIFTPNPEMLVLADKKPEFGSILNSADLLTADGIGVLLASKLNKVKIRERVTGYDLCCELFERLKNANASFYFFGSKPGVAEKAKESVESQYPGIRISGVADGYFDEAKEKLIIQDMQEKKPDIVLVGLGMERQEKWIFNNAEKVGAKVYIGVGGVLDGLCGDSKRAPKMLQRLGLEWLYRMLKLKRFKRQLAIPVFVFKVLKRKFLGLNEVENEYIWEEERDS